MKISFPEKGRQVVRKKYDPDKLWEDAGTIAADLNDKNPQANFTQDQVFEGLLKRAVENNTIEGEVEEPWTDRATAPRLSGKGVSRYAPILMFSSPFFQNTANKACAYLLKNATVSTYGLAKRTL